MPDDHRGRVGRFTSYDWKKGQHLSLDATGPLWEVAGLPGRCPQARGRARVSPASEDGWQQYVQVLLGSNEFLFID